MKMRKLEDLFLTELQDTYAAERLILAAAPKLNMTKLPRTGYVALTEHRIERLEQVFGLLGRQADAGTRPGRDGMLAEIDELGSGSAIPDDTDAALSVVETVRQYLLARYVTLASWATELNMPDEATLIAVMLQELRADTRRMPAATAPLDQNFDKGLSLGERLTAMFDRKR